MLNERITKPFLVEPKTEAEKTSDSRRAARGKKPKLSNFSLATEKVARAALKDGYVAYVGGICTVYHEKDITYLDVIYEDLDAETQTFEALIEDCAFHEDMDKRRRLDELLKRSRAKKLPKPRSTRTKTRVTARKKARRKGTAPYDTQAAGKKRREKGGCCSRESEHQHSHIFWHWSRPGIYAGAEVTVHAPRATAPPPGPGLPHGDDSGDDD